MGVIGIYDRTDKKAAGYYEKKDRLEVEYDGLVVVFEYEDRYQGLDLKRSSSAEWWYIVEFHESGFRYQDSFVRNPALGAKQPSHQYFKAGESVEHPKGGSPPATPAPKPSSSSSTPKPTPPPSSSAPGLPPGPPQGPPKLPPPKQPPPVKKKSFLEETIEKWLKDHGLGSDGKPKGVPGGVPSGGTPWLDANFTPPLGGVGGSGWLSGKLGSASGSGGSSDGDSSTPSGDRGPSSGAGVWYSSGDGTGGPARGDSDGDGGGSSPYAGPAWGSWGASGGLAEDKKHLTTSSWSFGSPEGALLDSAATGQALSPAEKAAVKPLFETPNPEQNPTTTGHEALDAHGRHVLVFGSTFMGGPSGPVRALIPPDAQDDGSEDLPSYGALREAIDPIGPVAYVEGSGAGGVYSASGGAPGILALWPPGTEPSDEDDETIAAVESTQRVFDTPKPIITGPGPVVTETRATQQVSTSSRLGERVQMQHSGALQTGPSTIANVFRGAR